jgi:hypothetical protein
VMIFQKLSENVKIRMHFSAKIFFGGSTGLTSWTSELNFSSAAFNQFLPGPSWLKPVEPA